MDYEAVIATNDDAALCKYLAATKGYYKDPFISKFIAPRLISQAPSKAPEINLGYYARSASAAYLVEQFINANPLCQIISIGAGYDSLYWRLRASSLEPDSKLSTSQVCYIELDLIEVTSKKMMSIMKSKDLRELLKDCRRMDDGLHSDSYHLISHDLTKSDRQRLENKLENCCTIDYDKPTLCLAECVLVYLPPEESGAFIKWLVSKFKNLTMINYEQCNMNDKFGEIMLANLTARHCDLRGVEACKSLQTQQERLESCGLKFTLSWTLNTIFKNFILPSEIERVEKLERLDEKELLEQLLEHYCVVVGSSMPLDWIDNRNYWYSSSCKG